MFEWMEREILRVSVKFLVFLFSSGYVSNLSLLFARVNSYEDFYSIVIRGYHSPEL